MKLILNIVMLHIKFKGTTHDSNMIAIIKHTETPLTTEEGVKRSTHFHLEISYVSYQIIWNVEHLENKHSAFTYTLTPWVVAKGQICIYLNMVMLHIK